MRYRARYNKLISAIILSLFMYYSLFGRLLGMQKASQGTTIRAAALSTAATTRRPVRIFCFGDSLTAGTSFPDVREYPYATHLEAALAKSTVGPLQNMNVAVRHLGYPGWTSSQLLEEANGDRGLRTMVRKIQDPSVSLVILLAGTNDLGYGRPVEDIVESVVGLHRICYEEQVPHTLAIGIPPSAYQSSNPEFAEYARQANEKIQAFCESEPKAIFFSFPFDWAQNDDRWAPDGLHFSARGYQILGEFLAPVVEQILGSEEEKESSS
jgi:lysophospholipase L1-like esterase